MVLLKNVHFTWRVKNNHARALTHLVILPYISLKLPVLQRCERQIFSIHGMQS